MPLSFDLSSEQKDVREAVRAFAEKKIKPVAHKLDRSETFSPELTKGMGELGLFGMTISQDYGGQGLDCVSYIIAVEELARIDGSQAATLAAHNSLGVGPIYSFGSEEQKKRYLPRLCTGDHVWAFGLTEPEAGSDAGGTKTKAEKRNGTWVLNGSKVFITNASCSASLGATVQAVTGVKPDGRKEYSCFLLEKGTRGYETKTMHDKLLWRSSDTSELYFTNV